ncbi:MAG: SlyX family protein [Methylococcales bacterium]|nr:SlyX family protein [Methylococcales bacterium]
MTENRLIELEIKVAYQDDLLQTLNDIIATQQQKIDRLERAYKTIHERVDSLASKSPEESLPNHELPPHY